MGREWKNQVDLGDIAQNDDLTFEQKQEGICDRLERFRLVRIEEYEREEYRSFVDDLRSAVDVEEFDDVLSDFYDWADVDKRLWLGMVTTP